MGQSRIQKIQSSIVELTQRGHISRQQAEQFIKDYVGSGQNIKDINYYIENESIDLFLKYFINASYPGPIVEIDINGCVMLGAEEKNQVKLAGKIVDTGCGELCEKSRHLIAGMLDVYLAENLEILCLREKIKDMIISYLEIESYRYYCFKDNTMRQTNSKILYLYDTPSYSRIYKYALSLTKSPDSSPTNQDKLEDIIKEKYLNYQNLCFQYETHGALHIVVVEINMEKWKYHHCVSDAILRKILMNIFGLFVEDTVRIYDGDKKMGELEYKNSFSLFTMLLLEDYMFLEEKRIRTALNQLNLPQSKKQPDLYSRAEEFRQATVHKIRKWRHYFNTKEKIAVLCYNQAKLLQFVYMSDQAIIDLAKGKGEVGEVSKCLNHFTSGNKKIIKKLLKACSKQTDIEKMQISDSITALITYTSSQYQNNCLTLQFASEGEPHILENKISQVENLLQREKILIKGVRNNSHDFEQNEWFKFFLKEENENIIERKIRKNNVKLPKLNKKYELSNHQSLYSIDELRQQVPINDQDINLLEFGPGKLEIFVLKVFSKLPFFCNLPHQNAQFPNFLRQIHEGYQKHNNKFHNFAHGANVMHTCFLLTQCKKNDGIMTDFDRFIIIFSGLCHDVGHTGFTNLFQIARESDLALTYNNKSPLEMFHISKTFEILKKSGNNFLSPLSQKQFQRFRQLTISSILYTDVKEHFNLMKKFESYKEDEKSADISVLAGMIIHASDFGGSVKKFQVCKAWSLLVNQEFTNQYNEQGRLGLPQTPFMKDLDKINILAKNQSGFLKVIVHPLYKQLSGFYCDKTIQKLAKNVEDNIKQWQKLMQEDEQKITLARSKSKVKRL